MKPRQSSPGAHTTIAFSSLREWLSQENSRFDNLRIVGDLGKVSPQHAAFVKDLDEVLDQHDKLLKYLRLVVKRHDREGFEQNLDAICIYLFEELKIEL